MEKGGMEGAREWCSLTWARLRPCPIMCASHRSQAVVSGVAIVVSVCGPSCRISVHSWVSVSVCGPSCRVRVRLWALMSHLWAFVSVGGRSYPFVGVPLGIMGGVAYALCLM